MEGEQKIRGTIKILMEDELLKELANISYYKNIADKEEFLKEITLLCNDFIIFEEESATEILDDFLLNNNIYNGKSPEN